MIHSKIVQPKKETGKLEWDDNEEMLELPDKEFD
jgi:hypothetical protein